MPLACPLEAARSLALIFAAAKTGAPEVELLAAIRRLPLDLPSSAVAAEDPTLGLSIGFTPDSDAPRGALADGAAAKNAVAQGRRSTVPLGSIVGVDFVLAGIPKAAATSLYMGLEAHPEVAFSEASGSQGGDPLFALGFAPRVLARERHLLLGGSRRGARDTFGLLAPEAVESEAGAARLLALRRQRLRGQHQKRRLKLVIIVQDVAEPFDVASGSDDAAISAAFQAPHTLLAAEFLGARFLPFWPAEDLHLVGSAAMQADPRGALAAVFAFLGLEASLAGRRASPASATTSGGVVPVLRDPDVLRRSIYAEELAGIKKVLRQGVQGGSPPQQPPRPRPPEFGGAGGTLPEVADALEAADGTLERTPCRGVPAPLGWRTRCCHDEAGAAGLVGDSLNVALPGWCAAVLASDCCAHFLHDHEALILALRQLDDGRRENATRLADRQPNAAGVLRLGVGGWVQRAREPTFAMEDPRVDIESVADCVRMDAAERAMCVANVRRKDPWGCLRDLEPPWARANAWVRCCGGTSYIAASVIIAPCPEVQCCVEKSLGAAASGLPPVSGAPLVPKLRWLTCAGVSDSRWRRFRKLLADPAHWEDHPLHAPSDVLGELAAELIEANSDSNAKSARWWVLRFHVRAQRGDAFNLDSDGAEVCIVGYASALYVAALDTADPTRKFMLRLELQMLLGVGKIRDDIQGDATLPLAWVLDNAGWPLSMSELVGFALGGDGGPLPRPSPLALQIPGLVPQPDTGQRAASTGRLRRVFLLTAHMFAVEPALALARALGEVLGESHGSVPLQWYGFPQKFLELFFGSPDVIRICASPGPPAAVTCGGPGAAALDRLIGQITSGRAFVGPGRRWPHNVHPGDPAAGGAAPIGVLPWPALVAEVGALAHGELGLAERGDLLVCGYPAALCLALDEALGDPGHQRRPFFVLALSGPPVEYTAPILQEPLRRQLGALAERNADVALLCFSRFDQAHLSATGLRVPYVYFGASYIPVSIAGAAAAAPLSPDGSADTLVKDSRQILVTRVKLALGALGGDLFWMVLDELATERLPFRLVTYESQYEYSTLGGFRAAVFMPWNWELITFLEWYAVGLPTFVPGPEFVVPLILHWLGATPLLMPNVTKWANLREEWAHGSPLHGGAPEMLEDRAAWVAAWWAQTDYARTPHVRRFAHIADLLEQLAGCDFDAWAAAQRASAEQFEREAALHYARLVQLA